MGTFILRVLMTNLKEQSTPKSPLPVALFITVQETSAVKTSLLFLVELDGTLSCFMDRLFPVCITVQKEVRRVTGNINGVFLG